MLAVHLLTDLPGQFLGSSCRAVAVTAACHLLTAPPLGLSPLAFGSPYFMKSCRCRGPRMTAVRNQPFPLALESLTVKQGLKTEFTHWFSFPNATETDLPNVTKAVLRGDIWIHLNVPF